MAQYTLDDLNALTFDDLPSECETLGKGTHLGKRFRTLATEAINAQGAEHRYSLCITRFDSPAQQAKAKLDVAEKRLLTLQNKDTDRVKDFSKYCDQLDRALKQAEALQSEWRSAERQQLAAPADRKNLKDHGRSEAQVARDSEAQTIANQKRLSSDFLDYLLDGTDVWANPTQRELLADFLEGKTESKPFYFMGQQWLPVLQKAGAITELPDGHLQASGDALRQAYHTFSAELTRKTA